MLNETNKGKKVELIYTSDPYTKLKPGDKGTYQYSYKNLDRIQHSIQWDNGSSLSLISGEDQFKFID
jgi:hypothetical protein